MSGFVTDELSRRINRFNDDQARVNRHCEQRLDAVESKMEDLKHRLSILTKILISKQLCSADEFASLVAASHSDPISQKSNG